MRNKKVLLIVATSVLGTPALANNAADFYGSIGAGVHRLKSDGFRDTAPTTKVLGGYNVNEAVAIEVSYTRLWEASDKVEGVDIDIDGNVWDLSAKLTLPTASKFKPYARLGWSYTDLSAKFMDDDERVRLNDYDNSFSWAAGVGVDLKRGLNLRGEYAKTLINDGDLDNLSLNLSYSFRMM